MTAANIIVIVLASVGLLFLAVAFTGICLFPDFFTRLHAQGVGDTIGALFILLAMIIATGLHLISVKIFLLFFVILLTNPIGTNLLMMAVVHNRDYQDYEEKVIEDPNTGEVVDKFWDEEHPEEQ